MPQRYGKKEGHFIYNHSRNSMTHGTSVLLTRYANIKERNSAIMLQLMSVKSDTKGGDNQRIRSSVIYSNFVVCVAL